MAFQLRLTPPPPPSLFSSVFCRRRRQLARSLAQTLPSFLQLLASCQSPAAIERFSKRLLPARPSHASKKSCPSAASGSRGVIQDDDDDDRNDEAGLSKTPPPQYVRVYVRISIYHAGGKVVSLSLCVYNLKRVEPACLSVQSVAFVDGDRPVGRMREDWLAGCMVGFILPAFPSLPRPSSQ